MATQHAAIDDSPRDFILRQRIFFSASATASGRINLSPRGIDALRVLGAQRRRLSRPDRQRRRDRGASARRPGRGRRPPHAHGLRLRGEPTNLAPLRARAQPDPREHGICPRAISALRQSGAPLFVNHWARGRLSRSTSSWCRPGAASACRSSPMRASAIRSRAGREPRRAAEGVGGVGGGPYGVGISSRRRSIRSSRASMRSIRLDRLAYCVSSMPTRPVSSLSRSITRSTFSSMRRK